MEDEKLHQSFTVTEVTGADLNLEPFIHSFIHVIIKPTYV